MTGLFRRRSRPAPAIRAAGPLRLRLRRTGIDVEVPRNRTALEALEAAGVPVDSLCRAGICGTCEIRPLAVDYADPAHAAGNPPPPVRLCVTVAGGRIAGLTLDL
jgi:hypothetical protein